MVPTAPGAASPSVRTMHVYTTEDPWAATRTTPSSTGAELGTAAAARQAATSQKLVTAAALANQ